MFIGFIQNEIIHRPWPGCMIWIIFSSDNIWVTGCNDVLSPIIWTTTSRGEIGTRVSNDIQHEHILKMAAMLSRPQLV